MQGEHDGKGILSEADMTRFIIEIVDAAGDERLTEDEIIKAVQEVNRMALFGIIFGLWQAGEASLAWAGDDLQVDGRAVQKLMQIQANLNG
jgi:hypothetical protein